MLGAHLSLYFLFLLTNSPLFLTANKEQTNSKQTKLQEQSPSFKPWLTTQRRLLTHSPGECQANPTHPVSHQALIHNQTHLRKGVFFLMEKPFFSRKVWHSLSCTSAPAGCSRNPGTCSGVLCLQSSLVLLCCWNFSLPHLLLILTKLLQTKKYIFFFMVYRTKPSRKLLDTLSRCSLSLQLLVSCWSCSSEFKVGANLCFHPCNFCPSISFPRGWLQSRGWQIFTELPLIVPACWGAGRWEQRATPTCVHWQWPPDSLEQLQFTPPRIWLGIPRLSSCYHKYLFFFLAMKQSREWFQKIKRSCWQMCLLVWAGGFGLFWRLGLRRGVAWRLLDVHSSFTFVWAVVPGGMCFVEV